MSIERIKFRGKATKRFQILTEHDVFLRTIECGQWVTTDDFIGAENTALANSDADRFAKFFEHVAVGLIDPATVGQWTGLVDSKGVEVYEGDRLKSIEHLQEPPIEAKPIQPTLIEAVEKYLHYFYDANPASGGINGETFQVAMRSALDRAKKREDLIEEILKSARSISNYDVHSMGIAFPKLCEEFRALDAFDRGEQ